MVLGTVIRYSVPLSFVYCTIYQQDIWREGDEKLILEQKRVWSDFFSLLDCAYYHVASRLSGKDSGSISRLNLAGKFESLDMRTCWNAKVMSTFSAIDRGLSTKTLGTTFDLGKLSQSITGKQ